jgi:serine O-acetyltransferase
MRKLRLDIERYRRLSGRVGELTTLSFIFASFNPRVAPVVLMRLAEYFDSHHMRPLAKGCAMLNVIFFGIETSPRVQIGGGLFLPHTVGTVIGAESIGENCTIMQGVTLGAKETDLEFNVRTRPIIGCGVVIGAGAKILGRITIGDHAKIGANAVVLCDVPPYGLAVGVPARIIAKTQLETESE